MPRPRPAPCPRHASRPRAIATLHAIPLTLALGGCAASRPPPAAPPRHPPPEHAGDPPEGHPGHTCHEGHGTPGGGFAHRFDNAEKWSKELDDPARDAWQRPDVIVASMAITPGMRVADIGAGTGYFLPHLSRAVGASGVVLALDIEPDMVRYMRARADREHLGNVRVEEVAADDPHLPRGGVDRVLIVDTWHHIGNRGAYAAKLRDALAPGGTVTVVDFPLEGRHGPPKEHRIAPERVVEELRAGGLEATVVAAGLTDQYIVSARAAGR